MYIVKKSDLIRELEGFPIEIAQKMIERQEEQGNPANIKIFQEYLSSSAGDGGFTWEKTIEGQEFWDEIVNSNKFEKFFEMYSKETGIKVNIDTNKYIKLNFNL